MDTRHVTVVKSFLLRLEACAGPPNIHGHKELIIDRQLINQAQYLRDSIECHTHSWQAPAAEEVAASRIDDAAVGSVLGGIRFYQRATQEMHSLVRRCIEGRGYRVLN
ncbi:MAG: hypothetical protein OSA42_07135 [Porticoccaceae bacterium]|nr:hypothetical protein [Porticoccaceae bacterium]